LTVEKQNCIVVKR